MELNIRLMATTQEDRAKGLMFAEPLNDDECAFFVFPRSDRYAFWNKNVPFRISLAFADENGTIVDFAELKDQQLEGVSPTKDARFVIEAKYGYFKQNDIKVGDVIMPLGGKIKILRQT